MCWKFEAAEFWVVGEGTEAANGFLLTDAAQREDEKHLAGLGRTLRGLGALDGGDGTPFVARREAGDS